jgi:hypothetical protein
MAARTKSASDPLAEARDLPTATVRVSELTALLTPIDEDVLHVVDMSAGPAGVDKKLHLGTVTALVRQGTASAEQGDLADTALQPGSVNLGYTATTRAITNTGGDGVTLPLVSVTLAGLAPASGGGTANFLRADGTWAAPAGGSGTVTEVTGTAPIAVANSTTTPVVSIAAASGSAPGSMSAADFTKLAGVASGATANSTDAQLRDRSTHTGTQTAATISDFTASSRAQVEATLTAGANITLTPSGTGATRTIAIASTASGGGDGTVTSVTGGAGLTGSVTTTGALAVGAGTGITVNADDVAINRTVADTWYASAAQGGLAATALQPGQAATTAQGAKADTALQPGQAATTAQGALADTALQPGSVDLGYTAASRTITNTGGDPVVLPLFSTTAGLVPGTASSTTQFLRADGTWVAPPAGTGTVTQVDGGAGLTGSVTTTGSLAVGAGTGISVAADAVAVDRTAVDTWYATAAQGTLAGTAVQSVVGTAPITATGTTTRTVGINAASGSNPGSMSSADFTKLAGIATGATANSTDAQLRDRSTHTGTQLASTISNFTPAVVAALPIATDSVLGVVKIGVGLEVDGAGLLSTLSQKEAFWDWSSAAGTTPNAGKMQSGNASWTAPTQTLYFHERTKANTDTSAYWPKLAAGDTIVLQQRNNANNFVRYLVAGLPVLTASVWAVPVSVFGSGGVEPNNNTEVMASFTYAADGGGGSGVTNLSLANNTANTLDVLSDTGTDATLPAATGSLAGLFTAAGFTKLSGVATGATANSSDAQLRDRSTHTGTQAGSTVTGAYTASGMTMATARMLGRSSASSGAVEEITIGHGLQLTGGSLVNTGTAGDAATIYLTTIFNAA